MCLTYVPYISIITPMSREQNTVGYISMYPISVKQYLSTLVEDKDAKMPVLLLDVIKHSKT